MLSAIDMGVSPWRDTAHHHDVLGATRWHCSPGCGPWHWRDEQHESGNVLPVSAGGFYGAIWKYAFIILIAAPLFAATDFVELRLVLEWRRYILLLSMHQPEACSELLVLVKRGKA